MSNVRRVAIIHYWLVGMRGGERVLERLLRLFPDADVFTHVYVKSNISDAIQRHTIKTTFIQRLPFASKMYQRYLPLMPLALEQLDLSAYDLVISSEAGPSKGVLVNPDAKHVCYCHSPMRYLWDSYHEYLSTAGRLSRAVMPLSFHRLRQWDKSSAGSIDEIAANSNFIRQRIRRSWGRDSTVVFPPVSVKEFHTAEPGKYYLWLSQLVPYKRPDLAVEAFNRLKLPLLVVGDGPMVKSVEKIAGPNISFKRRLNFEELKQTYAQCRALVFTGVEDFGMVPVEVNASGRPVIALRAGGALDTIASGVSGLFFDEQTVESLVDAVERFERTIGDYSPDDCRTQAGMFAPEHFDTGFMALVDRAVNQPEASYVRRNQFVA